jgi:hypothetical protein
LRNLAFYQVYMKNKNYELQVSYDSGIFLHSKSYNFNIILNPCDASRASEWRKGYDEPIDNLVNKKLWCSRDGQILQRTNVKTCWAWMCNS